MFHFRAIYEDYPPRRTGPLRRRYEDIMNQPYNLGDYIYLNQQEIPPYREALGGYGYPEYTGVGMGFGMGFGNMGLGGYRNTNMYGRGPQYGWDEELQEMERLRMQMEQEAALRGYFGRGYGYGYQGYFPPGMGYGAPRGPPGGRGVTRRREEQRSEEEINGLELGSPATHPGSTTRTKSPTQMFEEQMRRTFPS